MNSAGRKAEGHPPLPHSGQRGPKNRLSIMDRLLWSRLVLSCCLY